MQVSEQFDELRAELLRNRLWITLGYAVIGTVYLVLTSGLFAGSFLDNIHQGQMMYELTKGLGFVWISAGLIYAALRASDGRNLENYKRLLKSENELRELNHNRNLRQVTGGITHDLRNVLQLLKLHLINVREETDPQMIEESARSAEREVTRLTEICDAMTRACDPGETNSSEEIDLAEFIQQEVQMIRPMLPNGEVHFDSDEDLPPIRCDRTLLHRLALNLFYNAAQNTGETGSVRVRLKCDDGHVRLRLSNTGDSIPEEMVREINDEIEAGERVEDGHGWGLSIVQETVNELGASLRVERPAEGGAEFEVSFQT